jgi:hypothetical protein
MTPAINPCGGFSVITAVIDANDKFVTSDNDTGDKFIVGDKNKGRHEGGELPRIRESLRGQIGDISGRRSLTWPPMVSLDGTTIKSCIHGTPYILIRDP